jgi:hypothetical protein
MTGKRLNKKFSEIYRKAQKPENTIPFRNKEDRYVFFSDHHKGDSSAADDFKKNASLYDTALSFYQKKGFKLIVLGDNEELWENHYDQILPHYQELIRMVLVERRLSLLIAFIQEGRPLDKSLEPFWKDYPLD